jgi:hypothetical protein
MIKFKLFSAFLLIAMQWSIGQSVISGVVIDGEFNDPLAFANIVVRPEGTSENLAGAITDFEGRFSISVEAAGTYEIEFSYLGYETKIIRGVSVEDSSEAELTVVLNPSANALEEVVVTTTAKKNSESSVLAIQKGAVVLLDGLSAQNIRKSGDGNVASAIKRVPGVSIQGGKFVYVRGLGDRYSKTLLSGIEVPGLDPDKNTLQLDVFPTSLLDNILVSKSASADQPADFTGGLVDVVLRDFSTLPEYTISVSTSYNSLTNFVNAPALPDFSLNSLSFDSGANELPFSSLVSFKSPANITNALDESFLIQSTNALTKQLAVSRENNMMDYSFGLTASDQFKFNSDHYIGYIASMSYKYDSDYYESAYNASSIVRSGAPTPFITQDGELGTIQATASGLLGLSWKTQNSKHKALILAIRTGESGAFDGGIRDFIENPYTGITNIMTHTQREIISLPFSGSYKFGSKLNAEWKVAPSFVTVRDIDFRKSVFNVLGQDRFIIDTGSSAPPVRLWRDLDEESLSARVDIDYTLGESKNKLKFGGSLLNKSRSFGIDLFPILFQGNSTVLQGDFNNILNPDYIWNSTDNTGSYVTGEFQPTNQYESESETLGAYLSGDFNILSNLKAVVGLRYELYRVLYSGQDIERNIYDKEEFIDVSDIYPSVNLIYSLSDKVNIRGSYSLTTARPSFKENSAANIYDPITERSFLGNINLRPSYIDNFDIRYERFGEQNQFFAFSLFYKHFNDPIELNYFNVTTPNTIVARNSKNAQVYGFEFELRNSIIDTEIYKLSINLNASLIQSELELTEEEFAFRSVLAEELGEEIDNKRVLQGQSPYLINAGLNYNLFESNLEAGLFYNVQGRALQIIAAGPFPEVYTEPFHSLNFNVSKRFGGSKNTSVSLKADNLLNDIIESRFDHFGNSESVFSSLKPGTNISLGVSFKF